MSRLAGLESRAVRRPFELSGGDRQPASVARAMANRPALLPADEPTGAPDSNTGLKVVLLFRHIVASDGMTALVDARSGAEPSR